jgi:hypothetical protein
VVDILAHFTSIFLFSFLTTLILIPFCRSTKHADVQKAIHLLTPQNPTKEPTKSPLLRGDFICHTLPEFPGRLKTDSPDVIQYTLGRLSFGVFEPHGLVCTVRSVRQCIRVRLESKSGVRNVVTRWEM